MLNLSSLPLSPKQIRSIVESAHCRIAAWSGAVRSGKTIASLIAFLIALAEAPTSGLVVFAGRTLQTLERNLIEPLQDASLFGPVAAEVHHTRGSNVVTIMGRTVHLIGAANALAEGKLRGLTARLAVIDEATLVPQAFFTQMLARLSLPGARLLLTTNPDNPAHWLRRDYLLRAGELNLGHWHFALDDNPSLTPEYLAAIKAEFVGLWYKRMVLGLWIAAEGAIYDMFDEERHVVADVKVPHVSRWLSLGVDYGTTNPFAAELIGVGVDKRLYVSGEWRYDSRIRRRSKTDAEYSADVRAWLDEFPIPHTDVRGVRPEWTCVDPSAASFITQLWRDGLTPTPARNDVVDGIRAVSSLLARDKLRVVASCKGLVDEFPGYSWSDKEAAKGFDVPIKVDDHSLDGLRYGILTTEAMWRPLIA